jgi:RHS repeat-associated protein
VLEKQFIAGIAEKIIFADQTIKTINYITSPEGLTAIEITANPGKREWYWVFTDHLGSITTLLRESNGQKFEMSFDAWGNRRNADTWENYTTSFPDFIIARGFTGHEHLYAFNLINMNGRFYDPIIGRMLSPDNFMQAPDYSQNFNRYSYCLNNPLVYTDPSGEFIWAIAATWLLFTESGYEVQKYLSPVAVHIDLHFSSEQKGIGADASIGVPKILPISYRAHAGATYYWQHYDGSFTGWETRNGGEWTLGGVINYSGTTFNSGETSQTTNMITFGGPFINLKYENDYMFDLQLPGVPNADGGDRYRTSAVRLKYGPFTLGINLFTGDPGLQGEIRETFYDPDYNYRETYKENQYGDNPDKYRSGVLYVGFGPFKFGKNSENIRHLYQNQFAHDKLMKGESPYFKVLEKKPKWYFYFGTGTGNTLW